MAVALTCIITLLFVFDGVLAPPDALVPPVEVDLSKDELIRQAAILDVGDPVFRIAFGQIQQNCWWPNQNDLIIMKLDGFEG